MNRTMTVSQLSSYLKGVFDDEELLHDVTLSGEVTDVSYSDRHTFLVISDGGCSIKCVHFSARDAVNKGEKVELVGGVRFYDKRSSVTFNYRELRPAGVGDKNAKLEALKKKLAGLGYFENRPQLPEYVVSVVAVTSPDGAAIRDLVRVVSDKCPFVRIKVYPVKVQGEGAAAQMTAAVKKLQSYNADAIVLCRGGGSDEDLDAFNDEDLATAVALSKKPIISAVGHEIDYTLCDFCAGTRAGTPSIAGEIINSHAAALVNSLYDGITAAYGLIVKKLDERKARTERVANAVYAAMRADIIKRKSEIGALAYEMHGAVQKKYYLRREAIREPATRMALGAERVIERKRLRTEKLRAVLAALDPSRIMRAGYAAVVKDGKAVSSAAMLNKNDKAKLIFADGNAEITVDKVEK